MWMGLFWLDGRGDSAIANRCFGVGDIWNRLSFRRKRSEVVAYRHTQRGTLILALCLPIVALVIGVSVISGNWLPAIIVTIIMMSLATLFSSLTVEVDTSELRWFFGPGLWTYRPSLREIDDVAVVRNHWLMG